MNNNWKMILCDEIKIFQEFNTLPSLSEKTNHLQRITDKIAMRQSERLCPAASAAAPIGTPVIISLFSGKLLEYTLVGTTKACFAASERNE